VAIKTNKNTDKNKNNDLNENMVSTYIYPNVGILTLMGLIMLMFILPSVSAVGGCSTSESSDHPSITDYSTVYAYINNLQVSGSVSIATAKVGIQHTYQGDLIVDVGYSGKEVRIWNGQGAVQIIYTKILIFLL